MSVISSLRVKLQFVRVLQAFFLALPLSITHAGEETTPPQPPPVQPIQPRPVPVLRPDTPGVIPVYNAVTMPDLAGVMIETATKDPEKRLAACLRLVGQLRIPMAKLKRPAQFLDVANDLKLDQVDLRNAAADKIAAAVEPLLKSGRRFSILMQSVAKGAPEQRDNAFDQITDSINESLNQVYTQKLIENLLSKDPAIAAAADKQLTEMGSTAATYLADALMDDDANIKKAGFDRLKAMGKDAKEIAPDLSMQLDTEDKTSRRYIAQILEALGPDAAECTDDLIRYLDSDDKPLRRTACNILKKIGPAAKEGAEDLISLLTNDEKPVRSIAVEVLMSIGPAAAEHVEALTDIISDKDNDADSKQRAVIVLGGMGPAAKAALPVLQGIKDAPAALSEEIKNTITKISAPLKTDAPVQPAPAAPKP